MTSMTNFQSEELENIRRTAERGKGLLEEHYSEYPMPHALDCLIHILDTVERIKNDNKAQDSIAGY